MLSCATGCAGVDTCASRCAGLSPIYYEAGDVDTMSRTLAESVASYNEHYDQTCGEP